MKQIAIKLISVFCSLLISPALLLYRIQSGLLGADKVFSGWTQLFSLLPGLSGVYLRRAFLKATAGRCGDGACVSFGTVFSHPGVSIGQSAYLGNFCSIGNVTIEDDVLIASHVSVMNGCHQHGTERLDVPIREQTGRFEPVTIGRDTWIGEHATIAASIGRHCIIGAGSLVLKPVPDYCIAVGVPARIIRDRRSGQSDVGESIETSFQRADSALSALCTLN